MTAVDPVFAQWLQAETLWVVGADAVRQARWGDKALTLSRQTTIAVKADATTEAGRHLAFLGGPLVEDEHLLVGQWAAYLGRVITLTGDQLGYDSGIAVFVIGVQDDRASATSRVTVLRRL